MLEDFQIVLKNQVRCVKQHHTIENPVTLQGHNHQYVMEGVAGVTRWNKLLENYQKSPPQPSQIENREG